MDELDAIRRCQRGDMDGLEPLVAQYQAPALRLAYLLTGDQALAEDITQDSFLTAFRRVDRFAPGRPFGPWLSGIVANTARMRLRSRRRLREVWLDDALAPSDTDDSGLRDAETAASQAAADPFAYVEQQERRGAVIRALAALTYRQREAVALRYYLGYSDRECAVIVGCREGAFRVRLHDALRALKKIIGERYPWLTPASPTSSTSATEHQEVSPYVSLD